MFAAPRGVRSLGQFDTKWKTARGRSSHELLRGSTGAAGQLVTSHSGFDLYGVMAALDRGQECFHSGPSTPNRTGFARNLDAMRRHTRPKKQGYHKNQALRRPKIRLPRPILVREQFRRRLRALQRQRYIVMGHAVLAHQFLNLRIRHGLAASTGLHRLELLD